MEMLFQAALSIQKYVLSVDFLDFAGLIFEYLNIFLNIRELVKISI